MVRRWRTHGVERPRDRRQLARRHRRDRRPARGRAAVAARAAPTAQGGTRARVSRRASAGRSRATTSSCSRWTATSRTTRRTYRRCSPLSMRAPISCSAHATSRAAASENWGLVPAADLALRVDFTRAPPGCRARPRRAASSASAGACSSRSTSTTSTRRATSFQIEMTYRTLRRGSTSSRCRSVRRPYRGPVEDEPRDRARGRWKVPALRFAALRRRL